MTACASDAISASGLLSALDGIAYVVDPQGTIRAVGAANWDAFLARNGGPPSLGAASIVGRNLFDFVQGEEVAGRYRGWLRALRDAPGASASFAFRCDSPSERRELRMSMTRVEDEGRLAGFLLHSTVSSSEQRPPIDLFDVEAQLAARREALRLPQITMCSFCHAIEPERRSGRPSSAVWHTPEAYYATGGVSRVRISHGVCPVCAATLPA